jgi:hypothetical protein
MFDVNTPQYVNKLCQHYVFDGRQFVNTMYTM